jgi:hypothetical protein
VTLLAVLVTALGIGWNVLAGASRHGTASFPARTVAVAAPG